MVFVLIAFALTGVGYLVVTRWVKVSHPEQDEILQTACADADTLRRAHLLDEAAAEYGAIVEVDAARSCEAGVGAAARTRTAKEWRTDVLADLRISGELVERARQYRRAYVLHRGPSVQEGRRRARQRATSAYLVALLIDPGATGARRGLQRVLRGLGGPTRQAAADRRCTLAGRLLDAGLLPEARTVYAQALRTGRTTSCTLAGLHRLRATRAMALEHVREANQLRRAGDDKARAKYIAAFATDPSLTTARRALASVPGTDPADARPWSQGSDVASEAVDTAKTVTAEVEKEPATVMVGVVVLGLLFLLFTYALRLLARFRILRPWMDHVPWCRSFTRIRIRTETFVADGDVSGRAVTDAFEDAVTQPPLAAEARRQNEKIDLDTSAGDAANGSPGHVDLFQAPTFAGIAAVVNWLANVVPRQEIKVTGRLLEGGQRGPGLKLQLYRRRGRPLDSQQFWHDEVLSSSDGEKSDYADLARYAAAWVRHRKASRKVRGQWKVTGWFRVGRACQDAGRYPAAVEAYQKVLKSKGFEKNLATLHNLSVSQIRAGDSKDALRTVERLETELRLPRNRKELRKREFSVAYNLALALQYEEYQDDARKVSHMLVRRLLQRPENDDAQTQLEPPALMLHAGLLMDKLGPIEPPDDPSGDSAPAGVRSAAEAIVDTAREAPSRRELWEAIDRGDESAEDIVAYVRHNAAGDSRTCYNLACFEARLASRFEPERDRLLALALKDARKAVRDRKLAAWAREDPALRLKVLEGRPEWDALTGRQPAAAATA